MAAVAVHLCLMAGTLLDIVAATPASAQSYTYNPVPVRPKQPRPPSDGQMLVQATEVDYDYNNSRVSAVGNVQMFYNGTSVEADRVIYDQKTKRLHAEGNIRMTDADGKITYANIMDLSDDYRDGFVDSLRVDTADQTRMAATRADRSSGNYTVFENGVYTACAPCKDDPKKPPLWQVKGARIIHDQSDKMLYFENAQLEFYGVPMAYMPYFSTPDPTVKRKTGFLMPAFPGPTRPMVMSSKFRSTGRSRPITTRPSIPASPAGRACWRRPSSASASIADLTRSALTASTSSTPVRLPASPAIASSAAASKPRASLRSTTNGCGAGTASCCPTTISCRTTGSPNTGIRWARS